MTGLTTPRCHPSARACVAAAAARLGRRLCRISLNGPRDYRAAHGDDIVAATRRAPALSATSPTYSVRRDDSEFVVFCFSKSLEGLRISRFGGSDGRIKIARAKGRKDVDIPLDGRRRSTPCQGRRWCMRSTALGSPGLSTVSGLLIKWATEAGLPARYRLHGLKKERSAADGRGQRHDTRAHVGAGPSDPLTAYGTPA
jgi:hypothetical protein